MFNFFFTNAYAAITTDIGNVVDLGDYVSRILSGGVYLGYLIGGLVFAFAGLKMIVSSGNPESIGGAKSLMAGAVTGIIILYLISAIINLIGVHEPAANIPSFLVDSAHAQDPIKTEFGDVTLPAGSYPGLEQLFNNEILPNIFKIAGVLAVLAIIATGILLASSWGNPEKMVVAKKNFIWAILGMAIIIFSYAIVSGVADQIRTGEPEGGATGSPNPPNEVPQTTSPLNDQDSSGNDNDGGPGSDTSLPPEPASQYNPPPAGSEQPPIIDY